MLHKPRHVLGAVGWADDIRGRASAYAGAAEDGPPTAWTPEYCGARFAAAVKAGGRRYGPKAFGNNWPGVLVEFSDLVDKQSLEQHRRANWESIADDLEKSDPDEQRLMSPTLAEEAMRWPMTYLAGEQLLATSLIAWAMAQARLIRIEPFIRAVRLAHLHARERAGEALPGDDALELARWKAKIAEAPEIDRARHATAVGRFAAGFQYPTSKTSLHRYRKQALAAISASLQSVGAIVR